MSEDLIDKLADRNAIEEDVKFIAAKAQEAAGYIKQWKEAMVGIATAKTPTDLQGSNTAALNMQQATTKAIEETTKAIEKKVKVVQELTLEEAKQQEQTKKTNAEIRQMAKEAIAAENSLEKLRAELAILTAKKNKLNIDSEEYKVAEKNVLDLTEKVKKLEANAGDHRRNVGNYASGWTSFNNVIRETPNFAISATTGIQALSNNIPMFADEVKKARDGGKSWGSILKELGANLFSFGGIATLATIALTAMPKILEAMTTETDKAVKKFKSFSEVQNEASLSTIKERTELEALIFVAKDDTKSKEERQAAVKKINDIMPDYLGNITLEGINTKETTDKINLYIEQMGKKALAQAYVSKIQELYTKQIGIENSAIEDNINWYQTLWSTIKSGGSTSALAVSVTTDAIKAREKSAKAIEDELKATQKKFQEDLKSGKAALDLDKVEKEEKVKNKKKSVDKTAELAEKERKTLFDIQKMMIEAQMAQYKDIEKDTTNSYAVRLAAANSYYKEQQKLLDLQAKFEIETPKLTASEKEKLTTESRIRQIQAETAYLLNLRELNKAHNSALLEQQKTADADKKKLQDQLIQDGEAALADRQLRSQEQLNNALIQLNRSYLIGDIKTYEDYLIAKQNIEEEYSISSIEFQIDNLKKLLKLKGLSAEQEQKWLTQISDLEKQLGEASTSNKKKRTEDEQKSFEKTLDQLQRSVNATADAIKSVMVSGIESQKNAIQEQIDMIDKQKEAEIAAANASTLSAQEKADKIATINAVAQAKKEALERRQRELDQQRAKTERAFQIFSIIGNTAMAVTKFLSKGDTAEAIVAGIIGAAQLVAVLATPIPKYKYGTENHKGGMAIVGDGGKREMAIMPDGSMFETPSRPTLMHLPAGTKVKPDAAAYMASLNDTAMKMTIQSGGRDVKPELFDAAHFKSLEMKLDNVANAINAKPVAKIINTHSGIKYQAESMKGYIEYINKYFES